MSLRLFPFGLELGKHVWRPEKARAVRGGPLKTTRGQLQKRRSSPEDVDDVTITLAKAASALYDLERLRAEADVALATTVTAFLRGDQEAARSAQNEPNQDRTGEFRSGKVADEPELPPGSRPVYRQ
ncbi:hypothetical protein KFL_012880020 [Klebsormidium nitens]|uniref:Uncharacterized protein n=1 Tax=Klebsormidium nitens TaxID=105231 RepID=A0A1Y1ISQ8_KLENI|nr:hypothetical protein KFL_012880020 [Klebsormidium nitens]|eukprot:GAQ93082.1 hypothetical protein KFL_012880020 [Klebsormidium nitens]